MPAFQLTRHHLRHRRAVAGSVLRPGAIKALRQPLAGLAARRRRPVRLPRRLLLRAAQRPAGRGRPHQLPLAAADRRVLRLPARRTAEVAAHRRLRPRAGRRRARRHPRPGLRLRSGLYASATAPRSVAAVIWARLFGAVAPLRRTSPATPSPASASPPPCSPPSCHLPLEPTVWPTDLWQWAAIVGLGLGPVGLAFYVWDIGVKHGDIQVLGAASYSAPLLSTADPDPRPATPPTATSC